MPTHKLALLSALAAAPLLAQNDNLLLIEQTPTGEAAPDAHLQFDPSAEPELRLVYDALPGETVVVFMHVSLDVMPDPVSSALPDMSIDFAKGVQDVYPFLEAPFNWTAQLIDPSNAGYELLNPTAPLYIPPSRIRRHLDAMFDPGAVGPFGPTVDGNNPVSNVAYAPQWGAIDETDERWPMIGLSEQGVFDLESKMENSLLQAARLYGSLFEQPIPIADVSNLYNEVKDWRLHVQAVYVSNPDPTAIVSQPPRVRLSRVATVRVHSLKATQFVEPEQWPLDGGRLRRIPCVVPLGTSFIYLGGTGQVMTIQFPTAVQGLKAYVPMSDGSYREEDQLSIAGGSGSEDCAVFHYPVGAMTGRVDFYGWVESAVPSEEPFFARFEPVGAIEGGALVYSFAPLEFDPR